MGHSFLQQPNYRRSVLTRYLGGGATVWAVYNTGFSLNQLQNYKPVSSSSTTTSAGPSATSSASSSPSKKSSGSTVGIVVGVVVALVVVGALIAGGFIFLRRRQKQEVDEIKKQNDVQAFVKPDQSRPQMWAPDQRLDNGAAGRRVSNGSIADNQDFSRRILQVSSTAFR
jgi:cell wall integrity and stress response component